MDYVKLPKLFDLDSMPKKPAVNHELAGKDIISVNQFNRDLLNYIFARSDEMRQMVEAVGACDLLHGNILSCLFYEPSTRTSASFIAAMERLGGSVIPITQGVQFSSVAKGESLPDTIRTLEQYSDAIVIRHASSGAVALIAGKVDCPVLNAGDGSHEHPTQALLDALALRRALQRRGGSGELAGLRITICGDILHSRVARSNMLCLTALGAEVRVCAPPALMPEGVEAMGVTVFHDFDAALDGADAVMMLRLQQERMQGQFVPSPREFRHLYGLTLDRLARAKPDALVMHPGPMNRGIEIDSNVADLPGRSLITRQVEMGVAIRMACLDVLTRKQRGAEGWS